MDNLKRTLLVLAFSTFALLSFGQNSSDILTFRIYENGYSAGVSKIIVTDGEKVLEYIEFSRMSKDIEQNQVVISKALKKYLDNGYKIFSSVSGGSELLVTTYLLSKE